MCSHFFLEQEFKDKAGNSSWEIAAYFWFVTITTIGYGDITAVTWKGQLFVVCYSLIALLAVGRALSGLADEMTTNTILVSDKLLKVHFKTFTPALVYPTTASL